MRPETTRFGKTCDACGTAITVGRGEPTLCEDCRTPDRRRR